MSSENIVAIIKWGPLLLFLIVFLIGMLIGAIKGRRKAIKNLIYTLLFIVIVFLFTPKITDLLFKIQINGNSVEGLINNFLATNETIQDMCNNIPGLKQIIEVYPTSLVSLVLFLVLVFVGLPLSFPIYIIYSIIFNLISKKPSKYKRDEKGKIIRNNKGKKIRLKHDKHRLTGALVKGVEGVVLTSIIFIPVGVITRLYSDAKNSSENNDLSNIEYLQNNKDILNYIDAFNDSFIGKATNSALNESIAGYLSPIEIDGNKTTVEKELSDILVAAVYLEESGLIKLLSAQIDLKTIDLSTLNIDKIDAAIEMLFKSSTLRSIVSDGVNYVMDNHLKETLVNFSNDGDIVSKIKYESADEVKTELLRVTDVLREIINSKILTSYQNNSDNIVGIVNQVSTNDVEVLLNKVLSIKILSKCMPGAMTKLLQDYGLTSSLTEEDNGSFVNLVLDVIKLVQTLEITNMSDLTEGNLLDNVVGVLYKEGAIEENSMDALVTLLSDMSSSRVFDEILVAQLNKVLETYEIKLNAQMVANVDTKEDWKKELIVLENICEIYDLYNKENKVDFLMATELLENVKNSKAMVLALPIAYQKLFPTLGIEVDLNKIQYIDYNSSNASEEEVKFYSYWRSQVVHFENISDELARLEITNISDISLNLLEEESNVTSLSKILGEVFSADLLKDGVTKLITDTMADLLKEYEVNLNSDSVSNVNSLVNTNPYYISVNNKEYDIVLKDSKYYIGDEEVTITNNKVAFESSEYEIIDNSIARVWKHELISLSNIVKVIKTGEYTNKENLTIILNSVDEMALLKSVKNDLLLYAVKQVNVLPEEDFKNIDRTNVDFTKEKNILLNIIDDYEMLKDMSTLEFDEIKDDEIATLSNILTNVLSSNIFGDYAASTIANVASKNKINLSIDSIKNSTTWESDLKLIRKALNMDANSFNETSINEILTGIETSSLLSQNKEELLLNTARQISINGITIDPNLKASDIVYEDEKAAILAAAKNLEMIEAISTLDIKTVDTDVISELLAASIKSKLFGDSVVNNLVNVFNTNGIKHDADTIGNTSLVATIKAIDEKEAWVNEITLIKSLLGVSDKDEVTANLFTTIENSVLLGNCKANILIKIVSSVETPYLKTPLVSDLVNNGDYTEYNEEKQLLLDFASLDVTDITKIDGNNKADTIELLEAMKESKIFNYNLVVTDITKPISNNTTLSEWGLEVVDTSTSVPNINWNDEIENLLLIDGNVNNEEKPMTSYNRDNYNLAIIGQTLKAIDDSVLLSGSDNVADKLATQIAGTSVDVTKESNQTWEDAFKSALHIQ